MGSPGNRSTRKYLRREVRKFSIEHWATLTGSERTRRARRYWLTLVLGTLLALGFAALFIAIGVSGGVAAEWRLATWVNAGKVGGPFWLHALFSFGIATVFLAVAFGWVRSELVRRPPSAAELSNV